MKKCKIVACFNHENTLLYYIIKEQYLHFFWKTFKIHVGMNSTMEKMFNSIEDAKTFIQTERFHAKNAKLREVKSTVTHTIY